MLLQTAEANLGQSRFIVSLRSTKQGYHSLLHLDVSIFQQNGGDSALTWYDWQSHANCSCLLLHKCGRYSRAKRTGRALDVPHPRSGRWTPSCSVAMVFLPACLVSSGVSVSGMTSALQTWILTNNLSPSCLPSDQASFCWHYDEISGIEPRQYGSPATLALLN
jgi:hypothetical protein